MLLVYRRNYKRLNTFPKVSVPEINLCPEMLACARRSVSKQQRDSTRGATRNKARKKRGDCFAPVLSRAVVFY